MAHRDAQARVTGDLIARIQAQDPNAAIISAGEGNEFAFVQPMETFAPVSGLIDLDVAAGILPMNRYTYTFDGNTQQLDHMYVSLKLARMPQSEHVHFGSWVSDDDLVSDHDPSVAKINVCT